MCLIRAYICVRIWALMWVGRGRQDALHAPHALYAFMCVCVRILGYALMCVCVYYEDARMHCPYVCVCVYYEDARMHGPYVCVCVPGGRTDALFAHDRRHALGRIGGKDQRLGGKDPKPQDPSFPRVR